MIGSSTGKNVNNVELDNINTIDDLKIVGEHINAYFISVLDHDAQPRSVKIDAAETRFALHPPI